MCASIESEYKRGGSIVAGRDAPIDKDEAPCMLCSMEPENDSREGRVCDHWQCKKTSKQGQSLVKGGEDGVSDAGSENVADEGCDLLC